MRVHDVCCSVAEANVPKAGASAEHVAAVVRCVWRFICVKVLKKHRWRIEHMYGNPPAEYFYGSYREVLKHYKNNSTWVRILEDD